MTAVTDVPPEVIDVRWTAEAIVERSADGVTKVVVGVATHALMAGLPSAASGVHGALRTGLDLMQEADAETVIDDAVDLAQGQVSRLVGMGLRRAGSLLRKIGGKNAHLVVRSAGDVLGEWADKAAMVDSIVADVMARLYHSDDVILRSSARFTGLSARQRRHRVRELTKLRNSNERWVKPVNYLSYGLGPLWLVPLPVPVAPIAAAILLTWVVLISGDQMDASFPFTNFWRGVYRRSGGE